MKTRNDLNDELREASGAVTDPRPLVGFLYVLLRDELSAGVVEELLWQTEAISLKNPCLYTNGYLARYAQHVADTLGVTLATAPAGVEPTDAGSEDDARLDDGTEVD